MFNAIIDFYQTTKQEIISNQHFFSHIIRNIDIFDRRNRNISSHDVKKRCQLLIEYGEQQKHQEFIAGVFDLESLARNYPQYYDSILQFLSEFVQNYSPYISTEIVTEQPKLTTEIQAVLTVIARIYNQENWENTQLDLSNSDLRGANLTNANLEYTNLYHVNLAGANLSYANLSGAILSAADLCGANFTAANLSGAILSAANLSQANLTDANLSGANLYLANLCQANLDHAILVGANLRETKNCQKQPDNPSSVKN